MIFEYVSVNLMQYFEVVKRSGISSPRRKSTRFTSGSATKREKIDINYKKFWLCYTYKNVLTSII